MSSKLCAAAVAVLLASAVAAARAQPSSPASAASGIASRLKAAAATAPASAPPPTTSSTGAAAYRSPFDGYRPFTEQPVLSWRDANDQVGRIGGWQAYAREGQGGKSEGDDKTPMPASHGGMSMPSGKGASMPMSPAASSPGPSPEPVKVNPVAPASGGSHSGHKTP